MNTHRYKFSRTVSTVYLQICFFFFKSGFSFEAAVAKSMFPWEQQDMEGKMLQTIRKHWCTYAEKISLSSHTEHNQDDTEIKCIHQVVIHILAMNISFPIASFEPYSDSQQCVSVLSPIVSQWIFSQIDPTAIGILPSHCSKFNVVVKSP